MNERRIDRGRSQPEHEQEGSDSRTRGLNPLGDPAWLVRLASVGLCVVSIGFVSLFLFVLETGGELTLFTRTPPMRVALALPYLVALLTAGTAVGAVMAWHARYWSLKTRIHQTLLAILGLAFCWQLWELGFLGF